MQIHIKNGFAFILTAFFCILSLHAFPQASLTDDRFITYQVNPKKQNLQLYWKDDKKQPLKSILNLKIMLEKRQ